MKKCENDNDSENFDDMIENFENECKSLINKYTVSDVDLEKKFENMCF